MSKFYILELSVKPGGARKHNLHIAQNLEAVHRILLNDLIRDADLAIWYGEEIKLHICELQEWKHAEVIGSVDLHKCITFFVADFPPIKFDKNNKVIGYMKSEIFEDGYKDIGDPSPIDFTQRDISEVHRYLNYDISEIFRIMDEKKVRGSDMERYPPNVAVQIDLHSIPRNEDQVRMTRLKPRIVVDMYGDEYTFDDISISLE